MTPTLTELTYYRQKKIPTLGNLQNKERVIKVNECINSRDNLYKLTSEPHNTLVVVKSLNKRYTGKELIERLHDFSKNPTGTNPKKRVSVIRKILAKLI